MASLETAKDLANCAPPEGKTWSLFLKVYNSFGFYQSFCFIGQYLSDMMLFILFIKFIIVQRLTVATKELGCEAKMLKPWRLSNSYINIRSISQRKPHFKIICCNSTFEAGFEPQNFLNILSFQYSTTTLTPVFFFHRLSFAGIYAHCGNSYGATSLAEVERVRDSSRDMMLALKTRSNVI